METFKGKKRVENRKGDAHLQNLRKNRQKLRRKKNEKKKKKW